MPETVTPSQLSPEQIGIWLRGLLSVAWADGHFDPEEKDLIANLMQEQITPGLDLDHFQPLTPTELKSALGADGSLAENFLRTAVMVGLANGVYSQAEDDVIQTYCQALGLKIPALKNLRLTLDGQHEDLIPKDGIHPLEPMRHWLDGMQVHDPKVAKFLCRLIPPQCPFERDIKLFGRKIVHIPPLCKLNPLYDQLVGLRFRALSYLADECQEDITPYC
ncbi:Mo-dependent nitrogenase C-terminal domain-containing protein [Synechococcus sp. PCC 6312]|uniref:Mo-dependent nitrogenase C-terminal domain-containing protein n=1 Tax=Synechococcus sp. (strain ATCC 27167 / PCC 6312) TaxID=195253 RepID=UPI00029ED62B|nr:Mo-dependent nitrogenase C-terminal domain-containing protein [Synechococcus sp. PCC 6312]AFY60719.1 tellurite resistance protein [Synechococcus sp. PCC 6312]